MRMTTTIAMAALLLALLAGVGPLLVPTSVITAAAAAVSAPCRVRAGEALVDRLDAQLGRCFPDQRNGALVRALEDLKDQLLANEFDTTRQPLALVLFSTSPRALDRLGAALSGVVGDHEPHPDPSLGFVDLGDALDAPADHDREPLNYDIKRQLRGALGTVLRSCPARQVLVVRGLERIRGQRLPLLDVFLDPLNGPRGRFHDPVTTTDLDTRHAIVLFLFALPPQDQDKGTAAASAVASDWREFLLRQWTVEDPVVLLGEAFTPQAIVGRLSGAIVVPEIPESRVLASDPAWREACDLETIVERQHLTAPTATSDVEDPASREAAEHVALETARLLFLLLTPALGLVYRARRWRGECRAKRTALVANAPNGLQHSSKKATATNKGSGHPRRRRRRS